MKKQPPSEFRAVSERGSVLLMMVFAFCVVVFAGGYYLQAKTQIFGGSSVKQLKYSSIKNVDQVFAKVRAENLTNGFMPIGDCATPDPAHPEITYECAQISPPTSPVQKILVTVTDTSQNPPTSANVIANANAGYYPP